MRNLICVPMITLCLLLTGCNKPQEISQTESLLKPFQEMTGATMEAVVTCYGEHLESQFTLACDYQKEGETVVEVRTPVEMEGVQGTFDGIDWKVSYEDMTINAPVLSSQEISPMASLPLLMQGLQEGWLLEENEEAWNDIDCVRVRLDYSGQGDGKIVSTVWISTETGIPVHGELSVEGIMILQAEFTEFAFCDTIPEVNDSGKG